ncbi:MAG: hypothetical protein M1826_007208 [Phylliscum demangeonii]|nr:MAG: hypothetical protein M1826_007208 [Phylliscum demangeonii]
MPPTVVEDTRAEVAAPPPVLDFSVLPPIFVFPTRLTLTELHNVEDQLTQYDAPMTYDTKEAKLFIGKVGTKQRAQFELRCHDVVSRCLDLKNRGRPLLRRESADRASEPPRKRPKLAQGPAPSEVENSAIAVEDSSTEEEPHTPRKPRAESRAGPVSSPVPAVRTPSRSPPPLIRYSHETKVDAPDLVRVINLDWLSCCLKSGRLLSIDPFVVYSGQRMSLAKSTRKSPTFKHGELRGILERAQGDRMLIGKPAATTQYQSARPPHQKSSEGRWKKSGSKPHARTVTRPPQLLQHSTSDHDEEAKTEMPEMPPWVKEHKIYACQRSTPPDPPNKLFIDQLDKIKFARILTGDEIGVRAYSTCIASLSAYPHVLSSTQEILALPGCDVKIARLFQEWKTSGGRLQETVDIENDEALTILRLFYDIWGVGATTARDFYYERGWRDLDDVVEFGWSTLHRVQQIGVKYYDEFVEKIPRAEVEFIAAKVVEHAKKVRDDGIEHCIVGGYRRGKELCGDVDLILSHRDESQTLHLVRDVVLSLEEEGWITHTLLLSLTGTKRDQNTLPFRPEGGGHGFDTLDKALVVWHDTRSSSPAAAGDVKSPGVHRRVDIIISPWKTVGCAIVGWSGQTTFQRDLRRYARKVKGWKFDSSGIRNRASGHVVDLEGIGGESKTWLEAEEKVFEGLGLVYREPWERCTG